MLQIHKHRPYDTGPSSVSESGVEPKVPLSRQPGALLGPETWSMVVQVYSPRQIRVMVGDGEKGLVCIRAF